MTRDHVSSMHGRGWKVFGHQNPISSVKCHPDDPNVAVSAGWDGSLKIYDIRTQGPVGSIAGPIVVGDSLDIFQDLVVCGNNSYKNTM